MVNVAAVGAEDRLVVHKAPGNGERRIEQGNGEGQYWRGHPEDGARLLRPQDSIAAKKESDRETAGVAEKDRGGVEIVAQEGEQSTGQRRASGATAIATAT